MSGEVLINLTPMRPACGGRERRAAGSLHRAQSAPGYRRQYLQGQVVRVLPGMQAAFVDIGLERAAFIHVNEVVAPDSPQAEPASISHLLHAGQSLVVQVTKDPIGSKGARLTTHLSIPSRYLVYMPDSPHIGVSQRIEDDAERERLKALVAGGQSELEDAQQGGFIIRTAAEGVGRDELLADIVFLQRLWLKVAERRISAPTPSPIYDDLPLFVRTLRDVMRDQIEKIRIDSRENYFKLKEFAREFMPTVESCIEYYPGERPIFDLYSVEDEIQKALGRKVQLKSGGYLVIDQTEAMTTIDVNTGGYVGHRNLEETIFKTNLEAATAIARQLRLRNLGGIIIIDVIDMEELEHQRQVLRVLEKALERPCQEQADRCHRAWSGAADPQAHPRSLEQTLCEPCPTCHGRGTLRHRKPYATKSFARSCARNGPTRPRPTWCWPRSPWSTACSRGVGGGGGSRILHRQDDPVPGRGALLPGTVRHRVDVTR
ncbi:Rne/Rng family ribonuclease [Salinicola tamaricis]|uniref:Rne/Rng family ribonuclease n=1 Tax=Salinicola tamaricis TaxID=1771309 RepID=UPI001F5D11C3|nr:Rne/Rng family ribonuclease [Salinicola tamaricis]